MKRLGPGRPLRIEGAGKIDDAILVTVESGHHRAPRWSADAVRAETVFEQHALVRQTINVRRRRQIESVAIRRDRLRGQIVTEKEDYVGPLLRGELSRPEAHEQKKHAEAQQQTESGKR